MHAMEGETLEVLHEDGLYDGRFERAAGLAAGLDGSCIVTA